MAVKKVEKTEKVSKPKAAKVVKPKAEKVVKAPKAVKVAGEVKVPARIATQSVAGGEKAPKVEKVEKIEKVAKVAKNEVYFYAVGRRKASVAQVRLFKAEKATENDIVINDKKLKDYFPTAALQNNLMGPLKAVGMQENFRATVIVRGGGITGQTEAIRLGIARALVKFDGELKKTLKTLGFMTRDAREVERKKAGLKKARKAPQWAKR